MSDLIDRQAALNCFHAWIDSRGDIHEPDEMQEYRSIEALPSAQPEPKWIPCSERLPEKDGYYLTTTMYYQVYRDYWNGDNWDRTEMIIAWMPLPEPYKGEQK